MIRKGTVCWNGHSDSGLISDFVNDMLWGFVLQEYIVGGGGLKSDTLRQNYRQLAKLWQTEVQYKMQIAAIMQ